MESVFKDDEFVEIPNGDKVHRIRKSNKPQRFEDESKEDYKIRMKVMDQYLKHMKKGKFFHISCFLTPLMTNDGTILTGVKGEPIYNGKTKGVSFVKKEMSGEHKEIVEQIKTIIEHGKEDK
jgi:hypothetical protein